MRRRKRLAAVMMALCAAMPAAAQARHVVLFAAPVETPRLIVHGLRWHCAGSRCTARAGNSRPVVVCMALARALGPVSAFSTSGSPLDREALARCNAPRRKARS